MSAHTKVPRYDEEKVKPNSLLAFILEKARCAGRSIGEGTTLPTTAADNRALELAFLDGFLSTRVRTEHRSGPRFKRGRIE